METKRTTKSSDPQGATPVDGNNLFWRTKTIAELAAEQGIPLVPNYEALVGQGEDLWSDDKELEAFLKDLREARRKDAEP